MDVIFGTHNLNDLKAANIRHYTVTAKVVAAVSDVYPGVGEACPQRVLFLADNALILYLNDGFFLFLLLGA